MTARERFLASLNHEEPDRVPVLATLTPQVAEKLGREMNLPWKPKDSWLSDRISYTEILLELGNDAVLIGPTRAKYNPTYWKGSNLIDEFGFVYKKVGLYDEIIKRPLTTIETAEEVSRFRMPDPLAAGRWDLAEKQIRRYKENFAIVGDLETTIFELSWNLVGMEKFFMDLVVEKPYVFALMDKVLEYHFACGKKMIELGVDMIWTGDDFGTQKGMMISPNLWREVFKPRMQHLFKELKRMNPKVEMAYHSCGSIVSIIPDLIEIGVDVLNPIQPQAKGMELGRLKRKFGDKLVFFGGVDEQKILPFGSVQEVEEEVKLRVAQAGEGGGFIIAPAHNIQPDTPLQNIYAYFEAVKKYGTYPIIFSPHQGWGRGFQ